MKVLAGFFLFVTLGNLIAAENRARVLREELPGLNDQYHATPLKPLGPETPLSRIYYDRLNRFVRYAEKDMKAWPAEPGAKFHRNDGSQEPAVRQNGDVAFALAVLAACGDFDEAKAGVPREQVRADAIALINYLAVTHVANFLPTGDGKPWGDHWQSALWTGFAGAAAWLLWNDLPDDTRVMVARMVIHEANRYNTRPPDNGEVGDTKAEENAWNSEVIALAGCMFQQHPNAGLWRERAISYMFNAYSTAEDHLNAQVVDGKPLREWITTTNAHSDFTVENHNRVHPDYLSCFTLNLQNATLYKLAGITPPAATFHHARDCNQVLMYLTSTNGSLFYVNGQDWWPHRHEVSMMAEGLASMHTPDPDAAALELGALASLEKMHRRFDDGRAHNPREATIPSVSEELMIAYAKNYLAHRLFGDHPAPSSPRDVQVHQSGTRIFEKGGFATHRTPAKFVSFCWSNSVMGLVYPADDTWFISPDEHSLLGSITVKDTKDSRPKLENFSIKKLQIPGHGTNDGFAFVGTVARCEGKVGQHIAVISLPDAPVIYVEQLRTRTNVDVVEIATATVSILNEDAAPIQCNERRVWTAEGEHRMSGAKDAEPERHVWKTTWANLDDKVGLAADATGQMSYLANHRYRGSRLTQTLAANYAHDVRHRESGEIISTTVVELVPNATHNEQPKLQVKSLGKDALAILAGGWQVLVNLGAAELVSSGAMRVPAVSAVVQPARN